MHRKDYEEFSNVQKQREQLIPEEFPEGPVGSPIHSETPVSGKSTSWEKGQHRTSAFIYPDKEKHQKLERRVPGAHPLKKK